MAFSGYNWFLIIVAVIVAILAVVVSLYLLVVYMHPEDKNQAWFPKIVVIFGMSLSIWMVLLFPLDVANQKSCDTTVAFAACYTAIPAYKLWYAVYIMNVITAFFLCPYAMFYYEGDSDL